MLQNGLCFKNVRIVNKKHYFSHTDSLFESSNIYYILKDKLSIEELCKMLYTVALAELGGGGGGRTRGIQILSILCSFWENLAKSCVGEPPPGELAPPWGNPGSATG